MLSCITTLQELDHRLYLRVDPVQQVVRRDGFVEGALLIEPDLPKRVLERGDVVVAEAGATQTRRVERADLVAAVDLHEGRNVVVDLSVAGDVGVVADGD